MIFEDGKLDIRKIQAMFCETGKQLTKIKVVLEALWSNQNHPEATKIIEEFREDLK